MRTSIRSLLISSCSLSELPGSPTIRRMSNSHARAVSFSIRRLFSAFNWMVLLVLSLLSGCATVQTKPKADANLTEYRKIIIPAMEEDGDPRKVLPKVGERLRTMGFEVQMLKQGESIGGQGTGFIVNEQGHILTCAHVLGSQTNATVWLGSQRFEADVINADTNKDMALLKLRPGTNIFVPLTFTSSTNLAMGQDVFTLGFPLSDMLGSSPRLTKGLLSSTVGIEDNPDQMQVSAEVQAGNSGGPLLNERGEVIGLITATLNPLNVLARTGTSLPQNVNFATKGQTVRTFLSKAGITPRVATADAKPTTFDQVKDSIALVRAGVVPLDTAKIKEMICTVKYVYFWDMWYRFRAFQLDFYDVRKGDLLLRAGQYGDKVFTSEDAVIERVMEEVRSNFFPGQPKPAASKEAEPTKANRR